ncbi:tRNA (cytosine(38)-C(5))-methyltransferase [Leptopilina heterotoma]|uniref:tRNA (cytosine(38)-C(5))-methyltransferase n=1 Tax=Leptopilina heterotoma TaxID=63436 RepID=UPI001CA9DA1F|nr:tRNA (cytosine(38)-C(5))-methyltransferase [Leptopilina heterotoma]
MRVLELYSGIGGMHYAFNESNVEGDIIVSIDVNTVANEVYRHNFQKTKNFSRNIQSLSIDEIRKFNIDTILMSPPCQPFTRVGLKKDSLDNRSESLLHILKLIPQIETLKYIIVENVKGFEASNTRNELVKCLETKFNYKELLLSPCQFGVPNSRQRYYLLAKRKDLNFCFKNQSLINSLPDEFHKILPTSRHRLLALKDGCLTETNCYKLRHILDEVVDEKYLIPEKTLQKYASIFDIRNNNSQGSCCFTKAYGHYVEGTGSVFCPHSEEIIKENFLKLKNCKEVPLEELQPLIDLKLRYFTPKEVSRLMCFPEDFSFPNSITNKQRYRLLGNSINVHVVSQLIFLLNHEGTIS